MRSGPPIHPYIIGAYNLYKAIANSKLRPWQLDEHLLVFVAEQNLVETSAVMVRRQLRIHGHYVKK